VEPKKRSVAAGERDEFMRAAWRTLVAEEIDAERIVFVDEMGSNTSLRPLYAWSRKGKRAYGSAPRNWGKNVTLLASITPEGVALAWRSRAPRPGRSSKPTWSGSWRPP
jgi:DDE superfamily endonuclease